MTSRSQHLRITLTAAAAITGSALFLSGYWVGTAGGGATKPALRDSHAVPDWFLDIADYYDRNPEVTHEFDFASLYDSRPRTHVAGSTTDTGTLALRAVFAMASSDAACPPGTPPSIECHPRQGSGVVPGLGKVSESYVYRVDRYAPTCRLDTYRVLGYAARLIVAGKGEIKLAVDGRPECFSSADVLNPTQPFTITGGSGAYAGASGNGTLHHDAHFTPGGAAGEDTWVGTLVVAGLEFDVTAPTLSEAVDKTVRAPRGAKRVRVSYKVTARDEIDGVAPVSCRPRSGSRFKIGRTVVSCSALDKSGNIGTARFRITVVGARR